MKTTTSHTRVMRNGRPTTVLTTGPVPRGSTDDAMTIRENVPAAVAGAVLRRLMGGRVR